MVELDGDWRIDADQWNFILQKKKIRKKRDTEETYEDWVEVGYYPSLAQLNRAVVEHDFREAVRLGIAHLADEGKRREITEAAKMRAQARGEL